MIHTFDFIKKAFEKSQAHVDLKEGAKVMKGVQRHLHIKKRLAEMPPEGFMESDFGGLCEEIIMKTIGRLNEVNILESQLEGSKDIVSFIKGLDKDVTTEQFFLSFVAYARKIFQDAITKSHSSQLPAEEGEQKPAILQSYKEILPKGKPESALFFQRQKYVNWLMLAGLADQVPYDFLHSLDGQHGAYNFSTKKRPNYFAQTGAITMESLSPGCLKGKRVLCLADGNGVDGEFFLQFGASDVTVIDGSPLMVSRQKELKSRMTDQNLAKHFHVQEKPWDMTAYLKHLRQKGETVDVVFGHSVTHYFEDKVLKRFFSLIMDVLSDHGHLVFAVKGPGASHDGNGIPLEIREGTWVCREREGGKETVDIIKKDLVRTWLNDDGQTRFFRFLGRLSRILYEVGFQYKSLLEQRVSDYDLQGEDQWFYLLNVEKLPKAERRWRNESLSIF